MSQHMNQPAITLKAADESVPANRILTLSAGQTVDIPNTTTAMIIGVSCNDISATGQAVGVARNGTAKIQCGASVSAGALLTYQTSTGKCIEASANINATTTTAIEKTIGIAMEAGDTNSLIEVALDINNVSKAAYA